MKTDVLKPSVPCFSLLLALLAAPAIAHASVSMTTPPDVSVDCHVGTYRLADGGVVNISPDDDGKLSWISFDGEIGELHPAAGGKWTSTYGSTDRSDGKKIGFSSCDDGKIDFNGIAGQRVTFDVQDVTFQSHGTKLVGRLVLPKGAEKVPVAVFVHGSEDSSALSSYSTLSYVIQTLLPAKGIGMFVYDKRGTGKSGGKYTQDFSLLADDVDAAVDTARGLAGTRLERIGLWGGSQAGWVAPLAANRTHLDFVIVSYGLAVNVIDEDQESVELQMREKGYPPEVIAKGLEVAHAAEIVFESDFKQGYKELDAVRTKYGKQPWYKDVSGDFAFFILQEPSDAKLRALAPQFDWHVPFYYDPMPVLRASKTPQLWILGGEDYEAPSAETSLRIKTLIAEGGPFTLAFYPHAEHGITLFDTEADGTRVSTRWAPGYFAMIRDFAINGRLSGTYGDAEITPSRASAVPAPGAASH